jgi:hypothetical protein
LWSNLNIFVDEQGNLVLNPAKLRLEELDEAKLAAQKSAEELKKRGKCVAPVANKDWGTVTLRVSTNVKIQPNTAIDILCKPSAQPHTDVSWGIVTPKHQYRAIGDIPNTLLIPNATVRFTPTAPVVIHVVNLTGKAWGLRKGTPVATLQESTLELMDVVQDPLMQQGEEGAASGCKESQETGTSNTAQQTARMNSQELGANASSAHNVSVFACTLGTADPGGGASSIQEGDGQREHHGEHSRQRVASARESDLVDVQAGYAGGGLRKAEGNQSQGRCGLADRERSSDETWHEYLHRRGLLRPDGDLPTGTEMVEMLDAQAQARAAANHPDLVETDEERPNEIQQPDSGTDQD